MTNKFLSPEELAKKMTAFKDLWYGLSQKSEALDNYESGSDANFKKALTEISSNLENSKTEIQELETQLKHTFPVLRKDIGDIVKKINGEIDLFDKDIRGDMRDVATLGKLHKKLDTLNKDFKKADTKYRGFEKESGEVATKYFDMKSDYAQKRQNIENDSKTTREGLKRKFMEKAEPIIKDHEIYVGSEKLDLDTVFNLIIESGSTIDKIKLISKRRGGLLGRKSYEDNKARSSVLKYVGTEILEDLGPIKNDGQRRLMKLDSDFSGLKTLERECQKNEMKLKELVRPRDEISEQIARIKEDKAFRLLSQDGVLKIREKYLEHFNKAHEFMKEYLDISSKALEGYEPPESDLEKRELRTKNKKLSASVKDLKGKVKSAQKELNTKTKEFEITKDTLEKDLQKLEDTTTDLDSRLNETTSKLKDVEEVRDDYKLQIENLTAKKKDLERDVRGLKREKSTLEKQLEDTTAKLATSEEQREGYKEETKEMSQGLDALKKEMAERLKELESIVKTKIEDIKSS
ncbi:MAG: hypothetical protein ACE5J5_04200 [Candidatus Hydrothermarchaeales archaeon]